MIRSCGDKETEKLLQRRLSKKFAGIEKSARIRLELLDAASSLNDLQLPGLRLEALKGDRKGQYSIRINDQYRICFEWRDGDAYDVEIVDYH
jgi:proteic killer suppression protein